MQDDADEDDCRLLRGGAWYMKRVGGGGNDANCLMLEDRPQFGFRLVHDSVRQVYHGCAWTLSPENAMGLKRGVRSPTFARPVLGLRLCWEGRKE